MSQTTHSHSRHTPIMAGTPGSDATTAHCTAGGTISQMLDCRAAELRAENRSFRARCAIVMGVTFVVYLIAAIVFILFLGHLIQTSARNLAIDVGRAHEARW